MIVLGEALQHSTKPDCVVCRKHGAQSCECLGLSCGTSIASEVSCGFPWFEGPCRPQLRAQLGEVHQTSARHITPSSANKKRSKAQDCKRFYRPLQLCSTFPLAAQPIETRKSCKARGVPQPTSKHKTSRPSSEKSKLKNSPKPETLHPVGNRRNAGV